MYSKQSEMTGVCCYLEGGDSLLCLGVRDPENPASF